MKNFLISRMGIYISVGISNIAHELSALNYREAKEALVQKNVYSQSNLYFYEDIYNIPEFKFPVSEMQLLKQYLERKDIGNTEKIIREIFSNERIEKYHTPYIRMMWMQILNMLVHICGNDVNRMENVKQIIDSFSIIEKEYKIDKLIEHFMRLFMELVGSSEIVDAKNKILMAVRYIEKHYNEDISVNQLAEQYGMSSNYFSTLFKKELNQSTVNYITNLRISKAKEYLINTDKSVVEIANIVGYEDSNYFFRVFKKKEGVSPQKYREINQDNNR